MATRTMDTPPDVQVELKTALSGDRSEMEGHLLEGELTLARPRDDGLLGERVGAGPSTSTLKTVSPRKAWSIAFGRLLVFVFVASLVYTATKFARRRLNADGKHSTGLSGSSEGHDTSAELRIQQGVLAGQLISPFREEQGFASGSDDGRQPRTSTDKSVEVSNDEEIAVVHHDDGFPVGGAATSLPGLGEELDLASGSEDGLQPWTSTDKSVDISHEVKTTVMRPDDGFAVGGAINSVVGGPRVAADLPSGQVGEVSEPFFLFEEMNQGWHRMTGSIYLSLSIENDLGEIFSSSLPNVASKVQSAYGEMGKKALMFFMSGEKNMLQALGTRSRRAYEGLISFVRAAEVFAVAEGVSQRLLEQDMAQTDAGVSRSLEQMLSGVPPVQDTETRRHHYLAAAGQASAILGEMKSILQKGRVRLLFMLPANIRFYELLSLDLSEAVGTGISHLLDPTTWATYKRSTALGALSSLVEARLRYNRLAINYAYMLSGRSCTAGALGMARIFLEQAEHDIQRTRSGAHAALVKAGLPTFLSAVV